MDTFPPEIAKRKPGRRSTTPTPSKETLEVRRHRQRQQVVQIAEQTATAAAGAAVKALMPPAIAPEVTAMIEAQTQEAVRLVAANAAGIVQAAVDKCLQGDVGALSLMLKYALPVSKTKIRLPMGPNSSIEEFADSLVKAATDGELAIEDADSALRLLERHSAVTLNASLTARLSALNAQLESARATGLIEPQSGFQRVPTLQVEDVL